MKRIIREVVTIIKVERWLVEEDAPLLAETDTQTPPLSSEQEEPAKHEAIVESPLDPLNDPELIKLLNENTSSTTLRDGSKVIRVLSERVIDRAQYRTQQRIWKTTDCSRDK